MAEHLAALGGIEQRTDSAQLGQGGEHGEQLQAVFHQHCDYIAMAHAVGLEGPGQAVGPGVELAIAEAPLFIH